MKTSSRLRGALTAATVALGALAVLAPPGGAAGPVTRWASPTGSGSACTQADPCDLPTALGDAAVTVADGDEVVVLPGSYSVPQLQTDFRLDVHGQAGQPVPTVDITGTGVGFFVAGGSTVHDLTFTSSTQGTVVAVGTGSGGPLLERLTVRSTNPGGIACGIAGNAVVRDTVCWASGANTHGLRSAANVGTPQTRTITLRNVTAVGESAGLSTEMIGTGAAFVIDAKGVIARSHPDGIADVVAQASSGATVTVTLDHSSYGTEVEQSGSGSSATVTDPGAAGNQTAAPVFVDAANGDLRQAAGSPTVDAGAVDASSGDHDLDGRPRTLRGTAATACPGLPDIGAYELVSAYDCEAPDTTVSGPARTADTTPTFAITSTDPGSTFECRVDDGAFASCGTPFTSAPLSVGAHTVRARATDIGGNLDLTPAQTTVTVLALPETTITSAPPRRVVTTHRKVRVRIAFVSDQVSTTFECSLDSADFRSCSSPARLRVGKGRHVFVVRAVTADQVPDPTPAVVRFRVRVGRHS